MDTGNLAGLIERLEEEIETHAAAAERSRRLVLISRVAVAGGLLWLVAGIFRLTPLEATDLVFAIAAVIGGVVFAGSSRSTLEETEAAIRKAEAMRSQLIDRIDPEAVAAQLHGEDAEADEDRPSNVVSLALRRSRSERG